MQIKRGTVVALDYVLKDDTGRIIEESGKSPFYYLHGYKQIVPGLEEALNGRSAGDAFDVTVPPDKGFGERNDSWLMNIPLSQLPEGMKPMKGQRLQMQVENKVRIVTVTKVRLQDIQVDANHDLAGITLVYTGKVRQVRAATRTELKHGHAHGPEDHHHH
jgi:FKBP-type peptidyl-prolyl cis-trans isomerase SlyD